VYVSVLQRVAACCSVLWYFGAVDSDAKTYFGQQGSSVFDVLAEGDCRSARHIMGWLRLVGSSKL